MLSALFTSVADALISYAIDKLDPAERIKSWLRLDPARLAFKKALARAYSAFARQYPEYTSSLFDQSFLSTDALPELSKLLTRNQHPDPALLAQAWRRSLGTGADFAQAATKPAAYFLERFEAELKAEPALQSIFDSRALESLPELEANIQQLSAELQRGLDTALKAASDYQKVTLHIGGDIKYSNIIIGDNNVINNYYYSGDFVSLNEYYIPPDGVFQRVQVDEFVGRDWLTAKVDAFLNDSNRKSGAFLLIGDAGVGKTSFMAHLMKERRYLHLFAEQAPGQAMLQRAMQSLGSQLVTRYQIDPYKDRDTLNALSVFPDFLERILRLAASTLTEGEKIVIVCDALDEAGTFPDHFVFGLPKELPDGVYLILSQRPVNTKLPNFEPLRFDLEAQGDENLQDMEAFLSTVTKRPAVAGQIRAKNYSEDFFIQTLKEKSQGVWMYLHYVIKEIEHGQRAPLDLESLPKGLVGYYADYWDNWRNGHKGSDATKWGSLYAPLLATLAAAQEAITVDKLIEWAGVQANSNEVTRLLNESWSSFITEKEDKDKTVYTLYHQSLRDFITGKVEDIKKLPPTYASLVSDLSKKKVEAHKRIVSTFETECNGEWEKLVEQDYPRLHLTAHLNDAEEYEKLRIMLTEGDEHIKWAEAREKKEETYAGYLSDLTYVWDYAERERNYALAIRCMLIENSFHSLAANISPELLAELAKAGIWSPARCLSIIRQKTNEWRKAESLGLLSPSIPSNLLQEALSIAFEFDFSYLALKGLAPHLNKELKAQALSITRDIKNENTRYQCLKILAPSRLTEELKTRTFQDALKISDRESRAYVLWKLAPSLNEEFKTYALQEALLAVREIENEYQRGRVLEELVPYLNEELKAQAFVAALDIRDESPRSIALGKLAPHLNEELKVQALQEALSSMRRISNEYTYADILREFAPYLNENLKAQALLAVQEIRPDAARFLALGRLVPHLNEKFKTQALSELLAATLNLKDYWWRAKILGELSPYLNDESRGQILQEALSSMRQIDDLNRPRMISELSPYLNKDTKEQVLQEELLTVRKIKDKDERDHALWKIAPYLNEKIKAQALVSVREIKYEENRVDPLRYLLPHLNEDLKVQALSIARDIKSEWVRAHALEAITPHLNKELKVQALSIARDIKEKYIRALTLGGIAPHLEELKAQALQEALSYAHDIRDEQFRADVLAVVAPHLNEELKAQVFQEVLLKTLSDARKIETEYFRAKVLRKLVPHLDGELKTQVIKEAFSAALKIKDEYFRDDRTDELRELTFYLNEEFKVQVLQKALLAAREIQKKERRVHALGKLIPHLLNVELKAQVIQEILAVAQEIEDKWSRAHALAEIAPYLDEETKITILQKSFYFLEYNIGVALENALSEWQKNEFKGLREHIFPFLKFVSQREREYGMEVVSALPSALVYFSGPEIGPELYRTITDVTRWWP